MKRNHNDMVDYSTLILQNGAEETREALLYSNTKRRILNTSQESHTPVKIERFTNTDDNRKIIINDMSRVTIPNETGYSFQYMSKEKMSSSQQIAIADISKNCVEWNTVTIRGKAVHLGDNETVGRKKLKLAKAIIADSSGAIALDVWKEGIAVMRVGSVLRLSPVQIRQWNGVLRVTTVKTTVITKETDPKLSKVSVDDKNIKSKSDIVLVTIEFPQRGEGREDRMLFKLWTENLAGTGL